MAIQQAHSTNSRARRLRPSGSGSTLTTTLAAALLLITVTIGCASNGGHGGSSSASLSKGRTSLSMGGNSQPVLTETPTSHGSSCGDPVQCTTSASRPPPADRIVVTKAVCDQLRPDGTTECRVTVAAEVGSLSVEDVELVPTQPATAWAVSDSCKGAIVGVGTQCTISVSVKEESAVPDGASAVLRIVSDSGEVSVPLAIDAGVPSPSST